LPQRQCQVEAGVRFLLYKILILIKAINEIT